MCQRNLTRRSVPATESAVRKHLVGSGIELSNGTNYTDILELLNGTYQECFQLGGGEITTEIPYVSAVWMGLAFPFGIILGATLALLTFRFCCKKYWKEV